MAKLGQITRVEKQPATTPTTVSNITPAIASNILDGSFIRQYSHAASCFIFRLSAKVAELLTPVAKPSIRPDNSRAGFQIDGIGVYLAEGT
jgi:hypothetical protein